MFFRECFVNIGRFLSSNDLIHLFLRATLNGIELADFSGSEREGK